MAFERGEYCVFEPLYFLQRNILFSVTNPAVVYSSPQLSISRLPPTAAAFILFSPIVVSPAVEYCFFVSCKLFHFWDGGCARILGSHTQLQLVCFPIFQYLGLLRILSPPDWMLTYILLDLVVSNTNNILWPFIIILFVLFYINSLIPSLSLY